MKQTDAKTMLLYIDLYNKASHYCHILIGSYSVLMIYMYMDIRRTDV